MRWSRIRSLFRGLKRRSEFETAMSDELQFHVESRAEDLMKRQGLSRDEALRRARIEFGSVEKYKEQGRQARGLRAVDEFRADLRYAFRTLRNNPVFALAAIATLARGIGANTAVFSAADAVLLKALPVRAPDELVAFNWEWTPKSMLVAYSGSGRRDPRTGQQVRMSFPYAAFERFHGQNRTLSDVFAFAETPRLNVVADKQADVASGQLVTGEYFTGLGVGPRLGRMILPIDDDRDANPVAVISDRYWQRRFQGNPAIVGKTVTINNQAFTIVGVAAEGFFGTRIGESPDLSIPMALEPLLRSDGKSTDPWEWWVQIMGRLKPGATPEQVLADVQSGFEAGVRESWETRPAIRRTAEYQERTDIPKLRVIPGAQGPISADLDAWNALNIFFPIVGTILLIVCANLGNLFLARSSARWQELSVRLAIGASRFRLIRQLLTESVLLGMAGGALGLLLAFWCKDFLAWLPSTAAFVIEPEIDFRVFGFTAGLSLLVGIVFGVVPAFRATRIDIGSAIGTSAQKGATGGALVRKSFLVAQISASLVLLAGAGLFIGTVRNLEKVNVGFNPNGLVIFDLSTSFPRGESDRIAQQYDRLIQSISALPGTQSVTMSSTRTFTGGGFFGRVVVDGAETRLDDVQFLTVGDRFFETLEIPVTAGRGLLQTDRANTPKVAVINERAANLFFPGGRALGGRLRFTDETSTFEVVGVVRDTKYSSLRDNPSPSVFFPFVQRIRPSMTFFARTQTEPAAAIESIRAAVQRVDPNLPIGRITTQRAQIREIMGIERTFALFSGIFSIVALVLAAIGLYGVIAYSVNRRINEIGLRMALGARRHDVLRLVMREIFVVLLAGIALGLAGAFAVTRFIEESLYGVTRYDVATMAAAVAVMAAASAFAAFVPAWRASRVDPSVALRYE